MFCKIVFLFVVPIPPRFSVQRRIVPFLLYKFFRYAPRLSPYFSRDVLFFRAKKPPDNSDGSDLVSLILSHFILFYTTERLN